MGYVDQPPLSIWLLWMWTRLFGAGLTVIRIPMAICFAGAVVTNAILARELQIRYRGSETNWPAILAALTTAVAPVYMVVGHLYAMNGLDVVLSALLVLAWIRAEKEPKWWWAWGLLLGLSLLNKWSVAWLVSGMGIVMLVTPRRQELRAWTLYAGLALAVTMAAPSFFWQAEHGWPMLEFLRNARDRKMIPVPPWTFLFIQFAVMNVFSAPLLVLAVLSPLRKKSTATFDPMVMAFLVAFLILLLTGKSRPNYLSPAYACLIPVGAILASEWLESRKSLQYGYVGLLAASGLAQAWIALPLLPLSAMRNVLSKLPQPPSDEKGPKSALQGHADTLGWPELAAATQRALKGLTLEQRLKTVVLASNYGEAAALEFYGVSNVICPHNNYWIWGPGNWTGETALLVGRVPDFSSDFRTTKLLERATPTSAVPEEAEMEIHLATGLKEPVAKFWRRHKRFE